MARFLGFRMLTELFISSYWALLPNEYHIVGQVQGTNLTSHRGYKSHVRHHLESKNLAAEWSDLEPYWHVSKLECLGCFPHLQEPRTRPQAEVWGTYLKTIVVWKFFCNFVKENKILTLANKIFRRNPIYSIDAWSPIKCIQNRHLLQSNEDLFLKKLKEKLFTKWFLLNTCIQKLHPIRANCPQG